MLPKKKKYCKLDIASMIQKYLCMRNPKLRNSKLHYKYQSKCCVKEIPKCLYVDQRKKPNNISN